VKAGAEEMDQVRVEGSVLLAFDRAGLVKLDQFADDAAGFRGRVDIGFAALRFCLLGARIWPARGIPQSVSLGTIRTPVGAGRRSVRVVCPLFRHRVWFGRR
jgi:hypothetical protein